MKNDIKPKPQRHLINILKSTAEHHPNFVLFLGAGASKTSGVKVTSEMIDEWRHSYHEMYAPNMSYEDFIKDQSWYNALDEYSILFETLYDQPSQRREYIESCLKDATPSWGYIYLVNLLRQCVFNTVLTTNFDDLLNESCYQFSDSVRPVVCAHDSSIWSVRITSKRPKIIKLHGDFLFDNIKNTLGELESLEGNMKEKFRQYAGEYGLIVIGYSGSDRSVMDTLNSLLRNDLNFPHGIYWCIRKGETPNANVEMLQRFPKFQLIEIEGFDDFFADVHYALQLKLQPEMSDPYGSLVKRLNNLIDSTKIPTPVQGAETSVIQKDIEAIGQKIAYLTSNTVLTPINPDEVTSIPLKSGDGLVTMDLPIPFHMLAQLQERAGRPDQAIKYIIKEISIRPKIGSFQKAFELLHGNDIKVFLEPLMERLRASKDIFSQRPEATFNIAVELMKIKEWGAAGEVLDFGMELSKSPDCKGDFDFGYYILNRLQIKTHSGQSLSPDEKSLLDKVSEDGSLLVKMGASILLERYDEAEKYATEALGVRLVSKEDLITWPIFSLLVPHIDISKIEPLQVSDTADSVSTPTTRRANSRQLSPGQMTKSLN